MSETDQDTSSKADDEADDGAGVVAAVAPPVAARPPETDAPESSRERLSRLRERLRHGDGVDRQTLAEYLRLRRGA